jgi:hypothetical protein
MAKTRRNGRKKCGGSRKPKYNMKGCASKRKRMYGGVGSAPIPPLSLSAMNKMRGGYNTSCPTCKGSILGIGHTGGCTSCMRGGGSFYKTDLAPVPAPFVGKPWGPLVSEWPGVNNSRNFFTNNLYKVDPQTMMKLYDGGKRRSRGRRQNKNKCKCSPKCNYGPECKCGYQQKPKKLKGGAILSDFVGLGRDLTHNFQSMYNSLNGYNQPVSPKPYIQPALSSVKPV